MNTDVNIESFSEQIDERNLPAASNYCLMLWKDMKAKIFIAGKSQHEKDLFHWNGHV